MVNTNNMPDGNKPTFDPNKPFSTTVENKPAFNPKEQYTVEVAQTNAYADYLKGLDSKGNNVDEILNSIETDNQNEKQVLKNLAIKVNEGKAKHEDLRDAYLTIQGQHSKQGGEKNYYIEDNNGVHIPRPLGKGERPAKDKHVVDVFNDSSWYEDLGNSFVAGAEKLAASVLRAPGFLTDFTVEGSETIQKGINDLTGLSLPIVSDYYKKAGLKGSPSEQIAQSLGLQKENSWAKELEEKAKENKHTINQKYDQGITDYISQGDYGNAIGAIGNSISESLPVTVSLIFGNAAGLGMAGATLAGGAVFGAEKKQEMKEEGSPISENKQNLVALGSGLAEGLFEQFGITKLGSVFKKALIEKGEKEASKIVMDGFKEAYRPALNKFGIMSEEALGEAATQFTQNALDKYSGNKPDLNLSQGVADAFIVGGVMGGGFSLLGSSAEDLHKRKVDKIIEQNKVLFDVTKQGNEAIDAFKADILNGAKSGKISQENADRTIVKINAYNDYFNQTKDTKLKDEDKKRVFELTFEKANLEAQIPTQYEEDKMNAIEQAKIGIKKKQAKDIQAEIDKVFMKDELLRKETTAASKTIEDVEKDINPEAGKSVDGKKPKLSGNIKELYEKYKGELGSLETNPTTKKTEKKPEIVETRGYEEIPFGDWNQKRDSDKFKVLSEHLDNQNTTQTGELKLMKGADGEITNDTVHIKLPNDKWVILASSATDKNTKLRGHLHIENLPENFDGHKVVIKPTRLTTGRIVLPVYNSETGKHVGYVREDNTGKANEKLFVKRAEKMGADEAAKFQEKEIEELQHLKTVKLTKNEIEATKRSVTENKQSSQKTTPPVKETQPTEEKDVELGSKEDFIADNLEKLKQDEGADYDESLDNLYRNLFAEQYEKRRSTEGGSVTQEESTAGDIGKVDEKDSQSSPKKKAKRRTGTSRSKQKITDPIRIKALNIESNNPYDIVQQYFIKNGHISRGAIASLYKNSQKEINKRFSLWKSKEVSHKQLAHNLWEAYKETWQSEQYDDTDFYNAIEKVLDDHESRTDMARDLVKRFEVNIEEGEAIMANALNRAEFLGIEDEVSGIVEKAQELGNDELKDAANDQKKFDDTLGESGDIISDGEDAPFQKLKEYEQRVSDNLKYDLSNNHNQRKYEYVEANGLVLDTDKARNFSEEYIENPELLAGATHKPASDFVSKIYAEEIKKPAPKGKENVVVFTSGGSGSGKSRALENQNSNYHIAVDGTLSNFEFAKSDIENALKNGKKVQIAYTYRNPIDAFLNGVLPRALRTRRTVPYNFSVDGNKNSLETIIKLSEYYKNNPNVEFRYFNNNFNKGEAQLISLKDVKDIKFDFESAKKIIKNELERQFKEGEINSNQYYGLIGESNRGLYEIGLGGEVVGVAEQRGIQGRRTAEKVREVIQVIQESLPNIQVIYDENLKAAGKLSADGKTISINPYYAGIDTPIHEGGHVLIDAIGYDNSIIQKAIKQLKGTDLYKETKERYKELSEEALNKEVLAEAIGREGAGIFDKEVEKNVFMKYLDYIFNRIKQLLGVDKNIAKSLAKQIIGGIGTKSIKGTETGEEQFQKPKKFTPFSEKSKEQQIKTITLNFEQYSREILKRDVIGEETNLKAITDALENPDLTEVQTEALNEIKQAIEARKKNDLKAWYDYREDMKWAATLDDDIREIENKAESGKLTGQELIDEYISLYNVVNGFQEAARKTVEANLMGKMAYALFRQGKEVLKANEKFIEEVANKADISVKDVWLKNLGHMTEKVPELQVFSKIFNEASFDKVEEAKEKKNTFEKLGTAVIKETNKKLGITDKAKAVFSSDSAKYFEYMDNGNGELLTVNEAVDKGLSEAQINFLKFQRELIAEHQGLIMDDSVYNMPLQVLKTDPTFRETYKSDFLQAFSNYLGTNYNLKQVRIPFKNPETGIEETTEFGNVEKKLLEYGKKGIKEKAKTLALLLKYNRQARIQLKKGVNFDEQKNPLLVRNNSQYSMDSSGILSSKFDKPRDKTRGYSKDFYRAGIEFIDDMMHVKHMSKLVPIINSIEYLNKEGWEEHIKKPNVAKWIQEWRDLHLFKNPKQTIPELDVVLRFMRTLTSMSVMMFNVPAGIMNVAIGVYNNWRAENTEKVTKGHKRLFSGAINPYAIDILKKYDAVSVDYDSNPKFSFGRIFDKLGYGLIRWGEFQIQGSMFLGLMTEEEYNSFEYKENKQGVKELVVKEGVDEKALKKKLIGYKNRVSDIQGKYGESDQRNIVNNELGKAALQFKTYLPDAVRLRFGDRYIDSNGNTVEGSWRSLVGEGFTELRKQIRDKGFAKTFLVNESEKSQEAKNTLANLKGVMTVVFFAALAYQDDDDKKRSKAAIDTQNMLSQLMLIFNPQTLKFTVTRPIAAMGTIEKFLDAADHLLELDIEKFEKDVLKLTPANKITKVGEVFE